MGTLLYLILNIYRFIIDISIENLIEIDQKDISLIGFLLVGRKVYVSSI